LVGKIIIVSLKKGVERGFVLPGYPDKSFPTKRVLKVFSCKQIPFSFP
jgi:hypothetical protein